MVLVAVAMYWFGTKMWAVLDKKTQIVVGVVYPTVDVKTIEEHKKNYDLVFMTPENSPASFGNKYENNKFIKGDKING